MLFIHHFSTLFYSIVCSLLHLWIICLSFIHHLKCVVQMQPYRSILEHWVIYQGVMLCVWVSVCCCTLLMSRRTVCPRSSASLHPNYCQLWPPDHTISAQAPNQKAVLCCISLSNGSLSTTKWLFGKPYTEVHSCISRVCCKLRKVLKIAFVRSLVLCHGIVLGK